MQTWLAKQRQFIIAAMIFSLFGTGAAFALPYTPGETLNPTCSPGSANCSVNTLHSYSAPVATANYGLLSIGNGLFDGTTSGHFSGSSSGTYLAVNAASGYAGNLIDLQVAGSSQFKVTSTGEVYLASSFLASQDPANWNIRVGAGAGSSIASGATENTFVGINAGNASTTADESTYIGSFAGYTATGGWNTVVGSLAGYDLTSGIENTVLGYLSGGGLTTGRDNTYIGVGTGTTVGSVNESTAIGYNAHATASNQMVLGDTVTDVYVGSGVTKATPAAVTINASGGSGTNNAGANLTIAAGKGTGNATPGVIIFSTSSTGVSGSTLQSLGERMRINGTGVGIGASPTASTRLSVSSAGTTSSTSILLLEDSAGTDRMTVWSSGEVGILTTPTAAYGLTVGGSGIRSGGDFIFTDTNPQLSGSGALRIVGFTQIRVPDGTAGTPTYSFTNDTDNGMYYYGTNSIALSTGGVWGLVVSANQRVSIGGDDDTADYYLEVQGNAASSFISGFFNDGNATNRSGILIQAGLDDHTAASTSTLISFADGDGTTVGSITFGSSATAYNTTSDQRVKENIRDTSLSLSDLMRVQVRDYNFIADINKKTSQGFIAQELLQVYPQAVTVPEDPNGLYMVDYSKLMPLAIKSIQDLNLKVEDLKSLDTSKENTLGSLIVRFLEDVVVTIREATIRKLNIDGQVCVDDVCVSKEEFKQILINSQNSSSSSSGGSSPIEETPAPDSSEETPSDSSVSDDTSTPDPAEEAPALPEETPTETSGE